MSGNDRPFEVEQNLAANDLNKMPDWKEKMLDESMQRDEEYWEEDLPYASTDMRTQKESAGFPSDGL